MAVVFRELSRRGADIWQSWRRPKNYIEEFYPKETPQKKIDAEAAMERLLGDSQVAERTFVLEGKNALDVESYLQRPFIKPEDAVPVSVTVRRTEAGYEMELDGGREKSMITVVNGYADHHLIMPGEFPKRWGVSKGPSKQYAIFDNIVRKAEIIEKAERYTMNAKRIPVQR